MTITQISNLDVAVAAVQHAKEKADEANRELQVAQDYLLALLTAEGKKTHEFDNHRATLVKSTTLVFDEKGLRKAVGARVYNKLTTAKLDRKKVEKAVEDGVLDPVIVAQHATEKEGAPFLRLTEKK